MAKLDVRLINPVVGAVIEVMRDLTALEVTPGAPALKDSEVAPGYVTGVMTIKGPTFTGSVAISFPESVIISLASRILETKLDRIDGSVIDLVGEFTNMVTGKAAALFARQGDLIKLMLPTIIIGHEHLIAHRAKGKRMLLPLSCNLGDFYLEMCFET